MRNEATADIVARLARLEAREEIRKLKLRYGALCDVGYPADEIASLFTEDAVWDGGEAMGSYRGREEIRAFFVGLVDQVAFAMHFMIGDSIVLADDAASARGTWQMWEPANMMVEGRPESMWLAALYEDHYSLVGDEWRFSAVRLDWRMQAHHKRGWSGELLQL